MYAVILRQYDKTGAAIYSEDVTEFSTEKEATDHAVQQEADFGHPDKDGNYCRWTVEAL